MEDLAKKICPNCNQLYSVHSLSPLKGNLPLFLKCGHSMCENCIKNIAKFSEPIECKICQCDHDTNPIELPDIVKNNDRLYQVFPVDVFLLGELITQIQKDTPNKSDENFFIDVQSIIKSAEKAESKCIECHHTTSKLCKQCETVLCDACFNKTHKNFIVFKNHALQNIDPLIEVNYCKQHKTKSLEYYCKDCSKPVCMDCLMVGGEKSCKHHEVVSMQEVNELFLNDIKEMSPKINEVFKRLTKTAVDIGNLLYNAENNYGSAGEYTKILNNIDQHFSKLCSIIQKHKKEIIGTVLKAKNLEANSLKNVKNDVAEAIKKCKMVLTNIEACHDEVKAKQMNLPVLFEESKNALDIPWYLTKDNCNKDPMRVILKEDLYPLLNEYIHLEGNTASGYKLCTAAELPEDVEIPPVPTNIVYPPELPRDVRETNKKEVTQLNPVFLRRAPKYHSKNASNSSINSSESDNSSKSRVKPFNPYGNMQRSVQPVMPFAESNFQKPFNQGARELIYISHIVDPHNFYVQRSCHQGLIKEMLREFRNAISFAKPSLNHVVKGKIYLAHNKADNMWQRCRIMNIEKNDLNDVKFEIFYIDFGSTDIITMDLLRLIPTAKQTTPPLAVKCSLANCRPRRGSWNYGDALLMQNIIANKQAVMYIREVHMTNEMTLEVDVTTLDDGISLVHALVFHEHATPTQPSLPYPDLSLPEKPKIIISNSDYKPKSVENVIITHVVSPDKFFVRKCYLNEVFEKISAELETEYIGSRKVGLVMLPEPGMAVAVHTEDYKSQLEIPCGKWARGVVNDIHGPNRVRVLLPDVGTILTVHYTALRKIPQKFCTSKGLSTECHLAGVTPFNKRWNPASVMLLSHYKNQELEMHIEYVRSKDSVGVTLYYKNNEDITCINNEMIEHRYAIHVNDGLFKFNQKYAIEEQVYTNKSPLEEGKPKAQSKSQTGKQVKILKQQEPPKVINNSDLQAKDKGPLRLEVKVLNYQSPSLLYVSLLHQQKAFNELYDKMQKYYSKNKTQAKQVWNIGDRCCAFCNQSQTWRRAVILEVEEDRVKVFYSDFAVVETIPLVSLKELSQEFTEIGDAAIKCHLSGIIPAGSDNWPSVTKEYLKELLDAYKRIFITKSGDFKDKSMPVEIWVYHTIQGGALEPNTSEWRCLNMKIIDQGLGVPDKTQKPAEKNTNQIETDDKLSFLNMTGFVKDWLQLEPLPTVPILPSNLETMSPTSEIDEQNTPMTRYISDWIPAEPLQSKEFTGMPTYIDNNGLIYLHDVTQQDTLDLIRKALDVRFTGPDPKAKFSKWSVGEPCVARFFLDEKFYRGKVLEVNEETSSCVVHYIDYGNEETCSFEDMRKSIALHQIPIQAHCCVLNRIRPLKGQVWDRVILDYIHKSIVEKHCLIKVTGDPVNGVIPIELKYDKLVINDHLVEFEMAEYTDGSRPIIWKYAHEANGSQFDIIAPIETDSGPDYIVEDENNPSTVSPEDSHGMDYWAKKDWNEIIAEEERETFCTYPKFDEKEFMCNITVINDVNKLELGIIHDDETNIMYTELYQSVQKGGDEKPQINGIFENKACIARFHEDGLWYRATILEYSEEKSLVKVRYVDYGNIEIISLADVKEISEEWTQLPPSSISAKLFNIEVNPEADVNSITEAYKITFLDKGPFKTKVINNKNSIPDVELRDDEGKLIYENLLDSGIFIKSTDNDNVTC